MENLEFLKQISIWQVLVVVLAIDKIYHWVSVRYRESYNIARRHEERRDKITHLEEEVSSLKESVQNISASITLNNECNKNQIKSMLVEMYNTHTTIGWIDYYSLDSAERLFDSYKLLGGNSFVEDLMKALRELPLNNPSTQ